MKTDTGYELVVRCVGEHDNLCYGYVQGSPIRQSRASARRGLKGHDDNFSIINGVYPINDATAVKPFTPEYLLDDDMMHRFATGLARLCTYIPEKISPGLHSLSSDASEFRLSREN